MKDCYSQRSQFAARLPAGYQYTPSHFWLVSGPTPGRWRVGLTEFAMRMLGELVVVEFEKKPGAPVEKGEVLGFIEGLKALSDLFCVGEGTFEGSNPAFSKGLEVLANDPYGEGWLYEFCGEVDPARLDATGYRELLGVTVRRMQAAECPEEPIQ